MASQVKFKVNNAAIADLVNLPGFRQHMLDQGHKVAAHARSRSPVVTGRYRASFQVEPDWPDVVVVNTTEYAIYVEFRRPRLRVLGNALDVIK